MSRSNARSASGVPAEVGDREARVGGAEVGDEHDAGAVVEGEHGRRAAAGGGAAAGLVDEPVREQRVDALGDGRARQPGPRARSARVTASPSRIRRSSAPGARRRRSCGAAGVRRHGDANVDRLD